MKNPRQSKTQLDHPAEIYARQAANGEIVCSRLVRLAAQRHLKDLEEAHRRGLTFSVEAGQHVLDFFSLLNHSMGKGFAGTEFILEPWQQFMLWSIFGWKRADGSRRFRHAYVEVARKNGKSTLCAGITLYMLAADNEPGARIYCAATKKDQAQVVFEEAERMRNSSPALRKRIESFRNNLCISATDSKCEPLGADADTMDGLNIHCAIVDELHAHKSNQVLLKLETAIGARTQPLIFKITTAGHDRASVCWAERERSVTILEGNKRGDDVFAFIACIDEEDVDNWKDESKWIKANPNLGVSVKLDTLREDAIKADQQPSSLNGFLQLRLNVWTNAEHAAIKMDDWNKCVGFSLAGTDAKVLRGQMLEKLKGRTCIIGIDLSSTEDVSAVVKLFPPELPNEPFICIPDFWLPSKNVQEKMDKWRSHGAPYDVWAREGFLHLTDGDVIDYDEIQKLVIQDCATYKVTEITFDKHFATPFSIALQKAGVPVDKLIEFPQTMDMFAQPTQHLLEVMIPKQTIAHLANPMLRWMASNLVVKEDDLGRQRPTKKFSAAKIDGMVALIMAIGRAITNPPKPIANYEVRTLS